ncbi:MAG TPA: PEGA domain-containing protein [Vicinamibacterales bacterium]|nr:PEGA domain-containing protein [Vicinamibacterales bacterium]
MQSEGVPRNVGGEPPRIQGSPTPAKPVAVDRPRRFSILPGRLRRALPASTPAQGPRPAESADPLAQFASEDFKKEPTPRAGRRPAWAPLIAILAAAAAIGEGGYIAWRLRAPAQPTTGTLSIVSRPEAAELYVDGQLRGTTPVQLALPVGRHELELRRGTVSRREAVQVAAGAQSTHSFDLASEPGAAGTAGEATAAIELTSEPSGARVTIDGRPRGTTPLVVTGLLPGLHEVVLSSGSSTVRRQVRLNAGTTAVVMTPVASPKPPPVALPGYIRIESPVALEVYEDDHLIGTSAVDRIMLSAGSHTLRLASQALNFEVRQAVDVSSGQTRVVRPALPNGTLSINALPWAEVWVDGERKGETPIGNLSASIGQHEVVFRHPQLGEQRRSVTVTTGGITRVGVDLRR